MIRIKIAILLVAVLMLFACPSPNSNNVPKNTTDNTADNNGTNDNGNGNGTENGNGNGNENGNNNPASNKIASLSEALKQAKDNDVIDLSDTSKYNISNNISETVTINKAVTIKSVSNIDLSKATLNVAANNVNLSGLVNANVTTTSALGSGSLKIASSSLQSLILNGGGMNSINLENVTITDLTADYPWVRLHILDDKTKITNFVAKQNCKIEDDLSDKKTGGESSAFIEKLTVNPNVITEVKTVVDKLDIAGENAEVNLSRANSFIKSVVDNVAPTLFNTFRLTSIEEVKMGTILNNINIPNDYRNKVQYKTSEIINGIEDKTAAEYKDVSYNFDKFVKAWHKYQNNQEAQEWKNYANLRILDKYNGVPITGITPKALQMCQWLTSVDIGENVTEMGELTFLGCNNITALYMRPTTPPTIVPLTEGDNNPMLFYTTTDPTSDKTKLDRSLFSAGSDFISADCIDYFIEWYKQSIYKDQTSVDMLDELNNILSENDTLSVFIGGATIGHLLKSTTIAALEKTSSFDQICQAKGVPEGVNIRPSHIVESIMSEWDKTLTQTNMSQLKIYVPAASVAAYKAAPGWSRYARNIVGIDDFSAEVNAE